VFAGMLDMLVYNLNRDTSDVRLFEAGNIYERVGERTEEHKRVCLGATFTGLSSEIPQASALDMSKGGNAQALQAFRALKGDVEDLLARFDYKSLYFDEFSAEFFHPGRSARAVMDGTTVARLGQIHPEVAAARKLKQDVFVAEVYLDIRNKDRNKERFAYLEKNKQAIEETVGKPLCWEPLMRKRASRISVDIPGGLRSPDEWPRIQEQLIIGMSRLQSAMAPYLSKLP
jgi:phenylalanyl-tRNA synthetase beta subunit